MLGARTLYRGSAVHASCALRLEDGSPQADATGGLFGGEVLMTARASSIEVFRVEEVTSADGRTKARFCATGHSFVVGGRVLLMAPLRHQLLVVITRELELLVVRYQANLDASLIAGEHDDEDPLWVPAWRHWCVCCRVRVGENYRGEECCPLPGFEEPRCIVDDDGSRFAVQVFAGEVFEFRVSFDSARTVDVGYFRSCWRYPRTGLAGDSLTSGLFAPADPMASTNELMSLSRCFTSDRRSVLFETANQYALDQRWQQQNQNFADEDLLLSHDVAELTAAKRALYTESLAQEQRFKEGLPPSDSDSPAAGSQYAPPTVTVALRVQDVGLLFAAPPTVADASPTGVRGIMLPTLPENGAVVTVGTFTSKDTNKIVNVLFADKTTVLEQTPTFALSFPHARSADPSTTLYWTTILTTGPRTLSMYHCALERQRGPLLLKRSYRTGARHQILALPHTVNAGITVLANTSEPSSTTAAGARAHSSATESAVHWILLDDGSLEAVPVHLAAHGKEKAADPSQERCWPGASIDGLREDFTPCRVFPLRSRSFEAQRLGYTDRYAVLADDLSNVVLVDLVDRYVVAAMESDGALSSVCAGPPLTNDLIVAHTNGTLKRLSPALPLAQHHRLDVRAAGEGDSGYPLDRIFPVVRSTTELWVASGCAPGQQLRSDDAQTQSLCSSEEPALCVCEYGGTLVSCRASGVHAAGVRWEPFQSAATHAAMCVSSVEDALYVAVATADGELAVVMIAGQPWLAHRCFTAPLAPTNSQEGPGVSCLGLAVTAGSDVQGSDIAVLVGRWDGSIQVVSLALGAGAARECVPVVHAQSEARLTGGGAPGPVPLRLVRCEDAEGAAGGAEARCVWAVHSSDNTVSALSIAKGGGGLSWRRLRYTTRSQPSGSADESRVPVADGVGPLLSPPHTLCSNAPDGGRRYGAILMHGATFSLLWFTLSESDEDVLVEVEVQLQLDGDDGAAPRHWLDGFAVAVCADTARPARWDSATFVLCLLELAGVTWATVPASVLCFEPVRRPYLTACKASEPVVRTAPTYAVAAVRRCSSLPRDLLVKAVHCPQANLLLSSFVYHPLRACALLTTSDGATLQPQDSLALPGLSVLCAEVVPFYPSLPDAAETVQDLVLVGTVPQWTATTPQLLLVLPCPLRVVASKRVMSAADEESRPSDPVTDIAVQRRRAHAAATRGPQVLGTATDRAGNAAKGTAAEAMATAEEEEEIIVAVACGLHVLVYRLCGYALNPIAQFSAGIPCLTVSLCYPCIGVGCGDGGNRYLRLLGVEPHSRSHHSASQTRSGHRASPSDAGQDADGDGDGDGDLFEEDSDAGSGDDSVTGGASDDSVGSSRLSDEDTQADYYNSSGGAVQRRRRLAPDYPQGQRRMVELAMEPSILAPATAQAAYRNLQVVHTDMDGGVVFTRIDLPRERDACGGGLEMCLSGTNEADCATEVFHCVRLPSPPTAVTTVMSECLGADGNAAVWRRRWRRLRWAEQCVTLRAVNGRGDGSGPARLLFPCQDGSLISMLELPYAVAHPLLRVEQCYTDHYQRFLAPSRGATSGTTDFCFHAVPFSFSQALHSPHRTVERQGVLSVDALEELCALAVSPRPETHPHAIVAILTEVLLEDYEGDFSLADCAEICSAW